jgi:hypothetical protein
LQIHVAVVTTIFFFRPVLHRLRGKRCEDGLISPVACMCVGIRTSVLGRRVDRQTICGEASVTDLLCSFSHARCRVRSDFYLEESAGGRKGWWWWWWWPYMLSCLIVLPSWLFAARGFCSHCV